MTLEKNYHAEQREKALVRPADAEMKTLILRYLQAWETDDVDGLVALLKEDARLSMPPLPSWYWGREAIHAYLLTVIFPSGVQKQWCVYPTRTNGQHAFSV